MPTRAVLFDLGNTLISYYRVDEFPAILRRCLAACLAELQRKTGAQPDEELVNLALALNQETSDHTVRALAERLEVLFPECRSDSRRIERLCAAFMRPIFATARIDPDAMPVLETLRARGKSLAIVSNTPWGSTAASWRENSSVMGCYARSKWDVLGARAAGVRPLLLASRGAPDSHEVTAIHRLRDVLRHAAAD